MSQKLIVTLLLLIFLAVSIPVMAQEDDFVDVNDYDLNLTIEQRAILADELRNVIDISGEIDLGMIKIILGELEKDDVEFEKDYDDSSDQDNFGRGLAKRIKEYKANNENWTGQGLSNVIQNYKENNHPGSAPKNNPGNSKGNNGKGNGPGNSQNNPGKGN